MAGRLAVATAIIATVGALFSVHGRPERRPTPACTRTSAAIKKTDAVEPVGLLPGQERAGRTSPSWRSSLAPGAAQGVLPSTRSKRYKSRRRRNHRRTPRNSSTSRDEWSKRSDQEIHQHHRWAQATTALQISIALAAIALLTRSLQLRSGVYAAVAARSALVVLARHPQLHI